MNSRERIFKTLKEKELADRIPWTFDIGAILGINPNVRLKYKDFMNIETPLSKFFDYDVNIVFDPEIGKIDKQKFTGCDVGSLVFKSNGIKKEDYFNIEKLPKEGYLGPWGIYHCPWKIDSTYEKFYSPLENISDLKAIERYPSPTIDPKSIEEAKKEVKKIKAKNKISVCYSGIVYERARDLREQKRFFMDLYDNPKIVYTLIDKLINWSIKLTTTLEEIGVDILMYGDDYGTQNSLQISPEHFRKFIKPAWKKIWGSVKKKNTIIFLHSCGNIKPIIGDLIEVGLDVLHPIQPETMNVYEIYKMYHKDLAFWGTISSQRTIPMGSSEDIDKEIKERVQKLGRKGGFVVSPSNIIGPDVPFENITAFWSACKKYC